MGIDPREGRRHLVEKNWFGLGICFPYDRYDQRGEFLGFPRYTATPRTQAALETAIILWCWGAVILLKIGVVGVLLFFWMMGGLGVFGFVIYH